MEAMDRTDEVEDLMTEGSNVSIPSWTGGDSNDVESNVRGERTFS